VQERIETLHKLIPDRVACWTTKFKTVERDQLRKFPIAVITHAAFMTSDDKLDEMDRCWRYGLRTLTVMDEAQGGQDLLRSHERTGLSQGRRLQDGPRGVRGHEAA
jgi:hypothetical protein